jgi:hypothetical protein
MTTITDNFNRANGSIGSSSEGWSWTAVSGTWTISGNAASKTANVDTLEFIRAESDLASSDHYAQAKALPASRYFGGPCVRYSSSANTCYMHYMDSTVAKVAKIVAGAQTDLATLTCSYAQNSVYKTDVSGTTIEVFKDGVSAGSTTDSSIASGTRTGLSTYYNATEAGSSHWDDFQAADAGGGAATTKRYTLTTLGVG